MSNGTPNDVNIDQGPSPLDQGVTSDSPTAPDVNAPAPSVGEALSPEPAHEDAIPYDRFQQEITKRKELETELEQLRSQRAPDPEPTAPQPKNWTDLFGEQQPPQRVESPQAQQAIPTEDIEQRIRDDMYNKPFQTLYPIMMEAAKQVYRDQRNRESRVRGIKDFREVEATYYNVPEDVVMQTQGDPEIVRYLLAKHYAVSNGLAQPTPPPQMQQGNQPRSATLPPNNGAPATTVEQLAEKYRREGEERAMQKVRQQQGLTSESTASLPLGSGEKFELDDRGRELMINMGIPQNKWESVAKRIQLEEEARIAKGM